MTYFEAIFLGVLQGLTEFLPVSSSGHLALAQHLLGVSEIGVAFDLLLHAGTLLSVLIYFRTRLVELTRAAIFWRKEDAGERRLIFYLFVATLPIVVAGFTLKDPLEQVKHHPVAVSALLCLTGFILLLPQLLQRKADRDHSARSAIITGIGQAFALLPGISRSGSSIAAGMLAGVKPERAAEFSFLLAIPAIVGAIVLKSKDMAELASSTSAGAFAAGAVAAFVTGLFAVYAVLATIRRGKFEYFAYYCMAVGLLGVGYFLWVAEV